MSKSDLIITICSCSIILLLSLCSVLNEKPDKLVLEVSPKSERFKEKNQCSCLVK